MNVSTRETSQTDSPPPKRLKLEDTSQATTSSDTGLLTFCDDLILEIFSYLKPTDLLALSQCCQRLHRVVFDRTLWASVDFRFAKLSDTELKKYVKFFLPSTKLIATKGPWGPTVISYADGEPRLVVEQREDNLSFTGELLQSITKAAPNLTTLIIENHIIDAQDVTWDKMPPKLEHLSLRCCFLLRLYSSKSFFFGIDKYLPQLKTLDLTECRWFESHSFLALSKCLQLQELRLADCLLSDFVPYVSLGTRFGFKSLTVVDMRRTWVSDREISCLNKTPTLRELYLEAPGEEATRMISDLGVTSFGGTLEEWNEMGYFVVLMAKFEGFKPSPLQVLHICNYQAVTDVSLKHCASCLKGLKSINVKGTACSQAGVIKFKTDRPDVLIESNFDLEVPVDSCSNVDNT